MGETTLYVVAARGREVDMTGAQGWTLLGLVGVLISVIGAMMINQFQLLRAYLDARFTAVDARFTAVDARFTAVDARFTAVDVRFDAVDKRFDNLDRDVQAVAAALFRRD
jgi:hypothetical protein